MNTDESDCQRKGEIDKLANDALKVVETVHNHLRQYDVPKKLELGLERVEKDLNAIIMDDHKH